MLHSAPRLFNIVLYYSFHKQIIVYDINKM
jgi:hypothetical protein